MTLVLDTIRTDAADFLAYASLHPSLNFAVTPIGCGLAGYRPEQIAPLFADAPTNVLLPSAFRIALGLHPLSG